MPLTPLAPNPETALIRSCLAGNQTAWNQLVAAHIPSVMRLARRYGLTPQDAEDVSQETFFRVARGLTQKDQQHSLSAWIMRIARNLIIEFLTARHVTIPLDADLPAQNGDMQHSAEIREVFERVSRRLVGNEKRVWDAMTGLLTLNDEALARATGLDVATCHTTRMRVERKAREEFDRQKVKPEVKEHRREA